MRPGGLFMPSGMLFTKLYSEDCKLVSMDL